MSINYEEFKKLNKGTQRLIDWQFNRSGDFFKHLFRTIAQGDAGNQGKLAKGFPEEVEAYQSFAYEKGWWEQICERVNLPA